MDLTSPPPLSLSVSVSLSVCLCLSLSVCLCPLSLLCFLFLSLVVLLQLLGEMLAEAFGFDGTDEDDKRFEAWKERAPKRIVNSGS